MGQHWWYSLDDLAWSMEGHEESGSEWWMKKIYIIETSERSSNCTYGNMVSSLLLWFIIMKFMPGLLRAGVQWKSRQTLLFFCVVWIFRGSCFNTKSKGWQLTSPSSPWPIHHYCITTLSWENMQNTPFVNKPKSWQHKNGRHMLIQLGRPHIFACLLHTS